MVFRETPGVGRPAQKLFSFGDEPESAAQAIAPSIGTTIHRIRPPVNAHGGKYYLARRIVPILLAVRAKVTEYLEPCVFGGSVFPAMPRMQKEIVGDIIPMSRRSGPCSRMLTQPASSKRA